MGSFNSLSSIIIFPLFGFSKFVKILINVDLPTPLSPNIPIISFLKPGIIKVFSETEEQSFYVEDGIVEFKDNTLSVLTSSIFDLKDADKNFVSESISSAEAELSKDNIDDQKRFLLNHKVEVLKSISIN